MLLDSHTLLFLAAMALLVGFVKVGLPVLGTFVAVCMALYFPAKDALGLTLMYLFVGDLIAVSLHARNANWSILRRLLPTILLGIVVGIGTVNMMSSDHLGGIIGLLIIGIVAMEPFRPKVTAWAERHSRFVRHSSGTLAGFTTTVGNVAGPILTLYFLLLKVDKYSFVGTAALFFFIVNIIKLPLYASIGVFKSYYVWSYLLTVPLVFVGAIAGRRFLEWIPQKQFNQVVLTLTGIAGAWLFLRYFING